MRAPLIALLAVTFCHSPPSQVHDPDPWKVLRPLVGQWRGKAEGMFMPTAAVEQSWEFVIGDMFLQGHTQYLDSTSVHESLEMLSWDQARKCFVLRRFSSTGDVMQLAGKVQDDGNLIMESEAWENGFPDEVRWKSTLTFVSQDEIQVTYYLALEDGTFGPVSEMELKRTDE